MIRYSLILYLCLYLSMQAFAQEKKEEEREIAQEVSAIYEREQKKIKKKAKAEKHHEIAIGGIFYTGSVADIVYSILYQVPVGGGLELSYTYKNDFMRQTVGLRAGAGMLIPPYEAILGFEHENSLMIISELSYSPSFSIWKSPSRKFEIQIGPTAEFYINTWLPLEGSLRYTWAHHLSFGFAGLFSWQAAPAHRFTLRAEIPLFGIGWRPAYNTYTVKDEGDLESQGALYVMFNGAKLLSLHNWWQIDLRFSYYLSLGKSVKFYTQYQGVLQYMIVPRGRFEWQNNVTFGILLDLGG